jgi:modulator of FtsH protease
MWTDFFVAAAGASAALAGLVFVALSVNISQILRFPHLPIRAAATIGTLILILVSSMATLIDQPTPILGIEIIVFGLCGCVLQILSARRGFAARTKLHRPLWEAVLNAVLGQVQVVPFIVGGVLLVTYHDGGPYWVAGGCIAIFIFSVHNAWVLLVEILR